MVQIDISGAIQPTRSRVGGSDRDRAAKFASRFPTSAKHGVYIRQKILQPNREPPVNPVRTKLDDPERITREVKGLVLEMGANDVGIAAIDPNLVFTQAEEFTHTFAVVYGMAMKYDVMADIGPESQAEVHRVYHELDELGLRMAHRIAAYGYSVRLQPNEGDIPMPAFAHLAGIGELGKHGSMISPKMGSSFRLGAITTDMPLVADGPQDFGFDDICTKCQMCTRYCPGDAIKPEKKRVNGITRWYVDTPACEPYFHKLYGCKICLMVCPLNSRGVYKDQFKDTSKDLVKTKTAEDLLHLIDERCDLKLEEFETMSVPKRDTDIADGFESK